VSLAVAGIVMGAVYMMYQAQLQTQATQLATVEMNQHARAALMLLEREIRSAGTDPTGYAGAGFVQADSFALRFTRDIIGGYDPSSGSGDGIDNDKDGQTDEPDEWYDAQVTSPGLEDVTYALTSDGPPGSEDGIADSFPCSLGRDIGSGLQRVADNVEVLNFVYLDSAGAVLDLVTNPSDIDKIRSVQVTIILRSDNPVLMRKQRDQTTYTNLQGTTILPAPNDFIRRVMLSTEIRVRNTGLKS